jgi:hypothetical protein
MEVQFRILKHVWAVPEVNLAERCPSGCWQIDPRPLARLNSTPAQRLYSELHRQVPKLIQSADEHCITPLKSDAQTGRVT